MPFLSRSVAGKAEYFAINIVDKTVSIHSGLDFPTTSFDTVEDAVKFLDDTIAAKLSEGFVEAPPSSSRSQTVFNFTGVTPGELVTVQHLKGFLQKYSKVFDDMCDIEDLEYNIIKSWEFFLEYIDSSDFIGYDFSQYPTHSMMDSGSGDFFAGIIDINKTAASMASGCTIGLDACPIYVFNLDDPSDVPRYVGNFKTYVTILLDGYIAYGDIKHMQLANDALIELKSTFTDDIVNIDVPMTAELFARHEDENN